MSGRSKKMRRRFAYGQASARQGVHTSGARGFTLRAEHAVGPRPAEPRGGDPDDNRPRPKGQGGNV